MVDEVISENNNYSLRHSSNSFISNFKTKEGYLNVEGN